MTLSKLGRLATHSIVFATMNCNLALLPYTDCVSDLMQSNAIDVFALQESNVSAASWSSFQKCMKKKGYSTFHQKTERGGTLVTLLSRLPFEQGNPPGVTWLEPERVLTGRLHRPGMEPVLLANLYGHQDRDEKKTHPGGCGRLPFHGPPLDRAWGLQ